VADCTPAGGETHACLISSTACFEETSPTILNYALMKLPIGLKESKPNGRDNLALQVLIFMDNELEILLPPSDDIYDCSV